jgi:broad specificity phosphatase PhoE
MNLRSRPPFYMIRHGQTDWNREGRYQGQVDIPLNELGRRQAAGNGRYLATLGEDWRRWRFVSSPLGRARETMRIIRSELELAPDDHESDERLIEVSFGEWEERLQSELEAQFPQEMAKRNADKWRHIPPGGESYAQASLRVTEFLDCLQGPAVIVCHGGIIRGVRNLFEDVDGPEIANEPVAQDKIYAFDGKNTFWIHQNP